MRPDTKLKLARRRQTLGLLKWLYARRDPQLEGAKLSLEHRHKQEGGVARSRSLTYGEIDVPDFLSILDLVKPRDGEIFVDLGSGTGKAVLAAACGFPEFSKCRGIELVPGLADAAVDHLQMATAFLSDPGAPHPNTGKTDTGVTMVPLEESKGRNAGERRGSEKAGRGGSGGRKVKKAPSKAAHQGLSAVELEALIAELLSRQPLPRQDSCEEAGESEGDDGVTVGSLTKASAGEVASWLVRELGHRRYKSSLCGYGGLQKFLVARRGAQHDSASSFVIAEDGATIFIDTREDPSHSLGENYSPRIAGGDGQGGEATSRDVSVFDECLGTEAGAVDAGDTATKVSEDSSSNLDDQNSSVSGDPLLPPACTAEPTSVPCLASPSEPTSVPCLASPSPGPPCGGPTNMRGIRSHAARKNAVEGCFVGDGTSKEDSIAARRCLPPQGPLKHESLSRVQLVCGDIFQESWDDAGVVYVASLLFDDSMMALLAKRLQKLREGARIISLRPIPSLGANTEICNQSKTEGHGREASDKIEGGAADGQRGLRLLHDGVFRMSWQMARVYIYLRL